MFPGLAVILEYPERYSINGRELMKEKVKMPWLIKSPILKIQS